MAIPTQGPRRAAPRRSAKDRTLPMCGIFGIIGPGFDDPRREHQARLLHHRGPDGFGAYEDAKHAVYLAHCRLAIIDLSARGAQPMCNEDGTVWITYNGEIYGFAALRTELERQGHRFASATDTEVILHAYEEWGIACLERLNGMFAFALWDSGRGKLFLVRDRLGIKPLYYGQFGDTLAFASDTRALTDLPCVRKAIDPGALACYLLYKYVSGEASIWQGISRLPPAHYLEYDLGTGTARSRRYWDLALETRPWSFESACEEFADLFETSVKNCLVSDVPIGIFLSGGYDSSAIARAATQWSPRINSFCIGFDGWGRDERPAAAETARWLSTTHHEQSLGLSQFHGIDRVIEAYDEPLADSSIFPTYLVSGLARQHATVALSGDGGDELLGGYSWFGHTVHCTTRKRLAFLLEPLLRAAGLANSPWGRRCNVLDHYRLLTSPTFELDEIRRLFPSLPQECLPRQETYLYQRHQRRELNGYQRWQYVDLHTFLPDTNLMKVDRASMAHSLEVRVPFLDHRLVEFAFSLPEHLVAGKGQTKVLLANWLASRGLSQVLERPKLGFSCPISQFWSSETMLAEVLGGRLVEYGLLDRGQAMKLFDDKALRHGLKLQVLAILERWARRWLP